MHIAIVFSVRPSVTTLWEYFSNGTDDRSGWHAIRLRRLHKNYKELLRKYFRIIMFFFSWRFRPKVFYDWSHCTLIHFSSIMKCPSIILTPYKTRSVEIYFWDTHSIVSIDLRCSRLVASYDTQGKRWAYSSPSPQGVNTSGKEGLQPL